MSDNDHGSVEDIKRKIREGIFRTIAKDSARNELRKNFVGITSLVDVAEVVKLPYVSCAICRSVLTYNSKTDQDWLRTSDVILSTVYLKVAYILPLLVLAAFSRQSVFLHQLGHKVRHYRKVRWICLKGHKTIWQKRAGPGLGFNFDGLIRGHVWRVVKINGPGQARPDQRQAGPYFLGPCAVYNKCITWLYTYTLIHKGSFDRLITDQRINTVAS